MLTSLCCFPPTAHREDDDQEIPGEDDIVDDDDFTLGEAISYYRDMREKEEDDGRHSYGVSEGGGQDECHPTGRTGEQ